MTYPIAPTAVDPADVGERRAVLEVDHGAAVEAVRAVSDAGGMRIPVVFPLDPPQGEGRRGSGPG